jgi:hypothetical protein
VAPISFSITATAPERAEQRARGSAEQAHADAVLQPARRQVGDLLDMRGDVTELVVELLRTMHGVGYPVDQRLADLVFDGVDVLADLPHMDL